MGLLRSDNLPDLAARWLASDPVDTPSIRMLAGHDEHDPWGVDQLFDDAQAEAGTPEARNVTTIEHIIVDWVLAGVRAGQDIQSAVRQLAACHGNHLELSAFGVFTGLDDEWRGGWGATPAVLAGRAINEMQRIVAAPDTNAMSWRRK